MALTLSELKEKLIQQVDEVTLCEVLKLTPADLVEAFEDRIEEMYDVLSKDFDDDSSL